MSHLKKIFALVASTSLIAFAAGCFSVDYGEGGFGCAKDQTCPDGYKCVTENNQKVCRTEGYVPINPGTTLDGNISPDILPYVPKHDLQIIPDTRPVTPDKGIKDLIIKKDLFNKQDGQGMKKDLWSGKKG